MKKSLILILLAINAKQSIAQVITTFAGNGVSSCTVYIAGGYTGNGGAATAAELFHPTSVATDAIGNVYLSDNGNNVIRKVNTLGIINVIAGNHTVGYTGDGGLATLAQLNLQGGRIAADAAGNVYINDYGNNRIRKVNTAGIISTIAGNGTAGFSGDGSAATLAQLGGICGIRLDTMGNLYIADQVFNVIRKINTAGIINIIAGNRTPPGSGFSGDGGAATLAYLNGSCDVAVDGIGNVYIDDNFNNRIRVVNTAGIISTYVGNGTTAEINNPVAIAVDFENNVYITQAGGAIISKVNTSGIITTYAGGGHCGSCYCGDGGAATLAALGSPFGIATDLAGNLFIADMSNNAIRKVSVTDSITTNTSSIIIPNIFTPNGDSINDTFFVKGANITNFNCKIYDRWGALLYQWADINTGWNGAAKNGAASADGTYYYVINYTDNTGKTNTKNGFLQLLR